MRFGLTVCISLLLPALALAQEAVKPNTCATRHVVSVTHSICVADDGAASIVTAAGGSVKAKDSTYAAPGADGKLQRFAVKDGKLSPLAEYADTQKHNSTERLRFFRTEAGDSYMYQCNGQGAQERCKQAKDGAFRTSDNVDLEVKGGEIVSPEGKRCSYVSGAGNLKCEDRK